jgi:hypothetical protein
VWLFRFALMIVFILLLGFHSLLPETGHALDGTHHVFSAAWTQWFFLSLTALVLLGFAEIARRLMKDSIVSLICWLAIPFFGFTLVPGLWDNRVEITNDSLVYRRGYPQARYNADIPWTTIRAVTEVKQEYPGAFWGTNYLLRYQIDLTDGTKVELPSDPPLIAAQQEIDRVIAERKIPFTARTIPVAKEH